MIPALLLVSCAPLHVPEATGPQQEIYAMRSKATTGLDAVGVLEGPTDGWCALGRVGDDAWWVFQLDAQEGEYTCRVGSWRQSLRVTAPRTQPSHQVYGVYRCGSRLEPINPPIEGPDGSEGFMKVLPITCESPTYTGKPLPFPWPT